MYLKTVVYLLIQYSLPKIKGQWKLHVCRGREREQTPGLWLSRSPGTYWLWVGCVIFLQGGILRVLPLVDNCPLSGLFYKGFLYPLKEHLFRAIGLGSCTLLDKKQIDKRSFIRLFPPFTHLSTFILPCISSQFCQCHIEKMGSPLWW